MKKVKIEDLYAQANQDKVNLLSWQQNVLEKLGFIFDPKSTKEKPSEGIYIFHNSKDEEIQIRVNIVFNEEVEHSYFKIELKTDSVSEVEEYGPSTGSDSLKGAVKKLLLKLFKKIV